MAFRFTMQIIGICSLSLLLVSPALADNLYVSDGGVKVFDTTTGNVLATFDQGGGATGMALTSNGVLLVVNSNFMNPNGTTGVIEKFNASTFADIGPLNASGLGSNVSTPRGMVVDGTGNIYVASADTNSIEKYSSTGADLGVFASTNTSGVLR